MALQHEIGQKGEELATEFLINNGYEILAKNWRYSRAEIDIIAKKLDVLIFVEVKARSYDFYGQPEDFVTSKKQQLMSTAASAYMHKNDHDWEIRFDVISILFNSQSSYKITHFEDAFFLGL